MKINSKLQKNYEKLLIDTINSINCYCLFLVKLKKKHNNKIKIHESKMKYILSFPINQIYMFSIQVLDLCIRMFSGTWIWFVCSNYMRILIIKGISNYLKKVFYWINVKWFLTIWLTFDFLIEILDDVKLLIQSLFFLHCQPSLEYYWSWDRFHDCGKIC